MHLRGIFYALASSLMFGLGAVLAKILGDGIDATIVGTLSLALGGLFLTIGLLFARTPIYQNLRILRRSDWLDIFLLACPGTAIPLLLIVAGLARTSALVGGFLLQLNGVTGLIFAVLLLGERIRRKQGAGILLLLLGSMLVIFKGTEGGNWQSGGLGDLLIFLGTLGIGFGFIPAKRLTQRIDTLILTAVRLLIGACCLLPALLFQLITGSGSLLWHPSTTILIALVVYSVSNFCLGYLCQQEGLRLLKAWETAAITQTVPLFSTIFDLLLLHDTITWLQALGGAIAILGGVIVSLNNHQPEQDVQVKGTTAQTEREACPLEP